MKISHVSLFFSTTLVAASSGGLDDMAINEFSSPAVANPHTVAKSQVAPSSPAVAKSQVVVPASDSDSTPVSTKVINSVQVSVSGIASSSATGAYADAPLTTITTNDANGNPTTKFLWWIPDSTTTPAPVSSVKEESASSVIDPSTISVSGKKSKTLATSISILQVSDFSSVSVQNRGNSVSSSSHSRRADEPLTTVTTTDADGNIITSKVWWLPSSAYYSQSSDLVQASNGISTGSTDIKGTEKTTIESIYVSSSGSKAQTFTKTLTSNIRKAASIGSNSTSSSKNVAEGFAVPNSWVGAGSLIALGMVLL